MIIKKNTNQKKKIKGEGTAKLVWIIGAVFLGAMMLSNFTSIGNAAESTADCLQEGFRYLVYFLAYGLGLIYLFDREREKFAAISAGFYAAAAAISFLLELTDGGRMAAGDIVKQILMVLVYVIYAAFMDGLTREMEKERYAKCLKFWYLPAVFLFLVQLAANLWVELVRPAGFLWDGFLLDMALAVILILPVYTMARAAKERNISEK